MGDCVRTRLVVLGGIGVGKTSIIKQFLYKTFNEKHKCTVEDLYSREFDIGHMSINVDILDTAGDNQFPAMRRLSIQNAQAFLLVYSITDEISFEVLKNTLTEISECRADMEDVPIIVVGNKLDLVSQREVMREDVAEHIFCVLPRLW